MASVETVAVVPPPVGRRGARCNFVFSNGPRNGSRCIRVTDMAELRQRNKLACARAVTDQSSEKNDTPKGEKQNKGIESTVSAKTEKLFRQRKNENFRCFFTIPDVVKIEIQASCQLTVAEIKLKMLIEARKTLRTLSKSGKVDSNQCKDFLKESDDYIIKIVGLEEYLVNESLPLQRVDFIQVCNLAFVTPHFEMIEKSQAKETDEESRKQRIKSELQLGTQIASLVGSAQLSNFLKFENDEIADFRRSAMELKKDLEIKKAAKILQEEASFKDKRIQMLPEYLFGEPMPLTMIEEIVVTVSFPTTGANELAGTAKVGIRPVLMAAQVRDIVYNKYKRTVGDSGDILSSEDYILKVTGFQEYLYGTSQLISYDYIRRCISKNETIRLSLVSLASIETRLQEVSFSHQSIVDNLLALDEDSADARGDHEQVFSVTDKFSLSVNSVERALSRPELTGEDCYLFVHAELYHAGHKLGEGFTMAAPACSDPQWNEKIIFEDVIIKNIPLGTRVLFTVYHRRCDPSSAWVKHIEKTDVALSWVATQLYDHRRTFKDGMTNYRMWVDSKPSPIGTCYQNLLQMNAPILFTEYSGTYNGKPIYYPDVEEAASSSIDDFVDQNDNAKAKIQAMLDNNQAMLAQLDAAVSADPLTPLTPTDKLMLWNYRHNLVTDKSALSKFLLCVRWDDCSQAKESHGMLRVWNRPTPLQALELLDAKFADPVVREYGVSCLDFMGDGECYDLLLQLTQVLKHEPYHNSALSKFLLRRAWSNPKIGHSFYWYLKAEMHLEDVAERYTILLDSYLRGCGPQLKELLKQNDVTAQLVRVAEKVKNTSSADRKKVLQAGLKKLNLPTSFQLPLDQRVEVNNLQVEKCKYMDSKKLPLWLVWDNVEKGGNPVSVIFKVGDDLRQDVLTLQMIRIFDKLWKKEGLDLLLKPYGCIATGDEIGMIEVVKNADTTANINKAAGGTKAVLKEDTITKWLKQHNTTPDQFKKAQETFVLSCAGYCVATFVLGIGDRHNDNIMLTREGNLFHIDFGHFLGNYKKKYGIKRERAPFIFTPQYSHVLDGKNGKPFTKFVEICCKAFNILRRHKDMFITLFQMMLCTGIPELASADDINYLRYAFAIGKTDDEAAAYFKKLIYSSLNTKTTIINDAIHVFVHR